MSVCQDKLTKNLEPIFYPRSIAVVGATDAPGTVPHDMLSNLLRDNFNGPIFPVSPGLKEIGGVKTYKYIKDIEEPVDMAVLVFPSSVCHLAMKQCGEKGVKGAIIISAGFREVGGAGLVREQKIKDIAAECNIPFIGPNCLGVINTDEKVSLNASFARKMPEEGSIAFLSQSGALCTAVLDYAYPKGIGFSKFVSFGNKASITEIDLLYYLKDDPKTKVILLYLEEITDGPGLMQAARDVIAESGKPILMMKSGRTSEGAAAAASHTGSLAGSDDICDAALRQAGIIRCTNIEEMFNYAVAFAYQPLPKGKKVSIITNAGGPGVLTTDAAIHDGLQLAKFSDETTAVLKKNLPSTANIKNPVDVIGDARADRYNAALNSTLADESVDGAFVILTPQSMTDIDTIAHEVRKVAAEHDKPLYASFMGAADVASGIDILQRSQIPHYILPESMSSSYAAACRFAEEKDVTLSAPVTFDDVDHGAACEILDAAKSNGHTHLPEAEASKVLSAYGLPMLASAVASSKEEAGKLADQIGLPVVMKIVSNDIVHKFDVGGVMLNIATPKEATEAYTTIMTNVKAKCPDAAISGVYVQKMAPAGEEVILGLKRDPAFGPVLMFGLGGTFVEVLKDVSFRVAPLGADEILSMIQEIKTYPLLAGIRGKNPRDIDSIVACIQRLAQLAVECPQISELDINPLIVSDAGEGCRVADARIMLNES
jgi:acetate---CoA ligase (ADP-forming)